MKRTLILAVALLAVSCADRAPRQYAGIIGDASMNTLTVRDTATGATQTFSTADADMTEANGLLLGSPVVVEYEGGLEETTAAVKVTADATYAAAVGRWTMPDPIDDSEVMGIELQTGGAAASIRMATLPYTAWELQGEENRILLRGRSIGNGQTTDFEQTATLGTDAEGTPTLTIEGTNVVLTKEP